MTFLNTVAPCGVYGLRARPPSIPSSPRQARVILTPSKSASVVRFEHHDCTQVDSGTTALKVHTRLSASIHRFAIAYTLNCNTLRGRTKFNGGRDGCGQGNCEAAHAALTPTLYDDKLSQIETTLKTHQFAALDHISQKYLCKRFKLQPEEKTALSDADLKKRMDCFNSLVQRLLPQERKGTLVGTRVERLRNATYSNPKASNRVDCYLERSLRKLEDELAQRCTQSNLEPEKAVNTLIEKYSALLEEGSEHLRIDGERIRALEQALNEVISSQSSLEQRDAKETFSSYQGKLRIYFELYQKRLTNPLPGTPKLHSLMKYLKNNQSPYVIKKILTKTGSEKIFNEYKAHLKLPHDVADQFRAAYLQIKQRAEEIEIQKKQLLNQDEVHQLVKSLFGDESRTTPKKEAIGEHIIDQLSPRTPRRSDLSRRKLAL